jgi:hypothetical protein
MVRGTNEKSNDDVFVDTLASNSSPDRRPGHLPCFIPMHIGEQIGKNWEQISY